MELVVANIQMITKPEFTQKSWKAPKDYFFAAKDMTSPLGIAEISKAAVAMPLAFMLINDEYTLAAIQGVQPADNHFVKADGTWKGNYIPAVYRAYPFVLGRTDSGQENQVLCINTDSGLLIDDDTEEPFFNDELEPSPSVAKKVSYLSQLTNSQQKLARVCEKIKELGLIEPWELKYELGGEIKKVNGLFRIKEDAFNNLSKDDYADLREAGAIAIIYCQMLSTQLINNIAPRQPENFNFDEISTDGNINFDNI